MSFQSTSLDLLEGESKFMKFQSKEEWKEYDGRFICVCNGSKHHVLHHFMKGITSLLSVFISSWTPSTPNKYLYQKHLFTHNVFRCWEKKIAGTIEVIAECFMQMASVKEDPPPGITSSTGNQLNVQFQSKVGSISTFPKDILF